MLQLQKDPLVQKRRKYDAAENREYMARQKEDEQGDRVAKDRLAWKATVEHPCAKQLAQRLQNRQIYKVRIQG